MTIDAAQFQELIGENLSGVTFVRDYAQLQFNPPCILSAYTPVAVSSEKKTTRFGEDGFSNLLVSQINKVVHEISVRSKEVLVFKFEDDSSIEISLRPGHFKGQEALTFRRKDGRLVVIREDDI